MKHIYMIVAAVLCIAMNQACKNKQEKIITADKYIVTQPVLSDAVFNQEYVTEIQSLQNVELRSRAKGYIERIHIEEGQSVKKGQLLFTLNNREYKEEISKATAVLHNAKAQLAQIEVESANTKILADKNIISPSEMKMINARKQAVVASIQEANAGISLANISLAFTQIRAPFDGIVNRIPKKTGSLIEEGELLTSISNNSQVFAYFNVSERDYLQLVKASGSEKKVSLKLMDGSDFNQTGMVENTDAQIDPNTGTIAFRARFLNPDKILMHGSAGKIVLQKKLQNTLFIPVKSTYEVQENLYVFVVDNNGFVHQQKVDPIAMVDQQYAISSGLTVNDKVLYEGIQLLKDGDKIQAVLKPMNEIANRKNL